MEFVLSFYAIHVRLLKKIKHNGVERNMKKTKKKHVTKRLLKDMCIEEIQKGGIELFSPTERKKLLNIFYVAQLKLHNDPLIADASLKSLKDELQRLDNQYYKEIAVLIADTTEALLEGGYREV